MSKIDLYKDQQMSKIDFEKLEKYLRKLTYKDFCNAGTELSKIKLAHTVDDVFNFGGYDIIEKGTLVNYGDYFLVDLIGNDLTVVKLTRKKYKNPKGRLVAEKIVKTIINDCKKQYGSCINGYFHIPEEFYIN